MKSVALTGSIGSGKSTVLKILARQKIPVVDTDAIVKALYKDQTVKKKLLALFGTASKKEIARLAFSSKAKRKALEKLLHPLVWAKAKARLSKFHSQKKQLAFVDVPLLFEAGWQNRFSHVVFVKCPKAKCIERLENRGLSRKQALERWNSQIPQAKKIKRADYVIDNSGSPAKTRGQARDLIAKLSS